MYNNQSLEDRVRGSVNHERYDVQSEGTGRRYLMKWSPQEDMKFYSKSRYGSPRMLSKSVPRKNKNLARIRINRSLNSDAGVVKRDLNFKSPNSSLDSICCDDDNQLSEKQLSRSAKIMRALNLSSSLNSSAKKKVNKTLNFDMSPSPKRLSSYSRSPCNIVHLNLSTSSPKISKTLHFDSSPAESNISSILGTSIDSIDENQNQTPSQRKRSAKKSLKYLTPLRKSSIGSPDFNGKSPMLRAELKEKIDNIIQVATPNFQTLKKSNRKPGFVKEAFVSTPRNLFNDFDDEDRGGSKTPKNKIRFVPESMSAIKKSHKKERFSRRLDTSLDVMTNEALEIEMAEKLDNQKQRRSLTPPVQEDLQNSNYDVNSIKRSHKKDKSQRKLPLYRSEDELSESGSIFNCSGIKDISSSCEAVFDHFERKKNDSIGNGPTDKELLEDKMILTPVKLNYESDSELVKLNDSVYDFTGSKSEKNKVVIHITSPTTHTNEASSTTSKTRQTNQGSPENARPSTPKNRFDFLQRVIGSSIKKSHKKIKDENKKKLLKPRMLQDGLDDIPNQESQEQPGSNSEDPQASCSKNKETHIPLSSNRAATPDNINSSRLLLPQFSSVKKSHKKDKTSKILSSFARRQKIFSYDKERLSSSNCGGRNCSSLANDFKSYSLQQIDIRSSDTMNDGVSEIEKIQRSPRSTDSSPNKRKLSSCSDLDEACTPLSMDDSVSINYVTAEEEFKIFTPIKKRRAALTRKLSGYEYDFEDIPLDNIEDVPLTRCTTPVLDQSRLIDSIEDNFFTPERSTYVLNVSVEPRGKSTPKNKTTPKNRLTAELMSNVNSIKQSHRKDKKGSRVSFKNESARLDIETETRSCEVDSPLLRPPSNFLTPDSSLLSDNVSDGSFRNISLMASKFLQSYESEHCKPSTSCEIRDDNDDGEGKKTSNLTTTPPNLLKTKGYLRILQNDSIKKSHKKKKEELRHSALFHDPEISDDGSIFSEEDRVEDFSMDRARNSKSSGKNLTENRVTVVVNMNNSLFRDNLKKKRRSFQHQNPYNRGENSSDDGSIFDLDEKLCDRFKDFNEM